MSRSPSSAEPNAGESTRSDRARRMISRCHGSSFQKRYSPEFLREAVALQRRSGRSIREIAHGLGVLVGVVASRTRTSASLGSTHAE